MEPEPGLGIADSFYFCISLVDPCFATKAWLVFEIYGRNCFVVPGYHDIPPAIISLAGCTALPDYFTSDIQQFKIGLFRKEEYCLKVIENLQIPTLLKT